MLANVAFFDILGYKVTTEDETFFPRKNCESEHKTKIKSFHSLTVDKGDGNYRQFYSILIPKESFVLKMAKGDPNSKAALKKKERKAEQRKMDARVAIVKTANLQDDPLASLPSFKVPTHIILC